MLGEVKDQSANEPEEHPCRQGDEEGHPFLFRGGLLLDLAHYIEFLATTVLLVHAESLFLLVGFHGLEF